MKAVSDQEIIDCAILLDSDLGELCFEKLRDVLGAEPTRVALLTPLFDAELDPSLRTALAIVIVSVTDYEPAKIWLAENDGWTVPDFKASRERFRPR
jgi:hypothetical protein